MRATEILSQEHRVIELVLACVDRIADDATAKGAIDAASARDALSFIRTFADGCHHGKEEERLFPAMERRGMPREAGPTAVMRYEHELGRGHVKAMDAALTAFEAGDASGVARFAKEAHGYVELLRDHIAKEDDILFPMADGMLDARAQEELLREFHHVEEHEMGAGTHERFLALAQSLAVRWGVTQDAARACAHVCGCSHAGT